MRISDNTGVPHEQLKIGVEFLHAYLKCDQQAQQQVRSLLAVAFDPYAKPEDRNLSITSVTETLFPNLQLELAAWEQASDEDFELFDRELNG